MDTWTSATAATQWRSSSPTERLSAPQSRLSSLDEAFVGADFVFVGTDVGFVGADGVNGYVSNADCDADLGDIERGYSLSARAAAGPVPDRARRFTECRD